jgi:hypothetical protein
MADNTVGFDLDLVLQNIGALMRSKDVVPASSEMSRTEGPSSGVASTFHSRLSHTAIELGQRVDAIRETLESSRAAIKQTIDQFIVDDGAHAAEANQLMAAIDSMASQDSGSTISPSITAGAAATGAAATVTDANGLG